MIPVNEGVSLEDFFCFEHYAYTRAPIYYGQRKLSVSTRERTQRRPTCSAVMD